MWLFVLYEDLNITHSLLKHIFYLYSNPFFNSAYHLLSSVSVSRGFQVHVWLYTSVFLFLSFSMKTDIRLFKSTFSTFILSVSSWPFIVLPTCASKGWYAQKGEEGSRQNHTLVSLVHAPKPDASIPSTLVSLSFATYPRAQSKQGTWREKEKKKAEITLFKPRTHTRTLNFHYTYTLIN